jgi:hypothetical protein
MNHRTTTTTLLVVIAAATLLASGIVVAIVRSNHSAFAHNEYQKNYDNFNKEDKRIRINNNNVKIKNIAKVIVNTLLSGHGELLTSAIIAVIEALRVIPYKCTIIFNNSKYDNSMIDQA